MQQSLLATLVFVFITVYTPGPNNITCAAMGVLHGYRKTLPFLIGISVGFYLVLVVSALVTGALLSAYPALESILRWVGAAYILYLAFSILKATYSFEEDETPPLGLMRGLLLQLVNPKLMIFLVTLFSTFLAPVAKQPGLLLLVGILFAINSFAATSLWTLFGSLIKNYLHHPRIRLAVNALLSALLVYSAIELTGLI